MKKLGRRVVGFSVIIDAFEARDVATADVAGAYLKAFMDDFVIMKFVGPSVRILCELNPAHQRYVTTENGVEVLLCPIDQGTLRVRQIGSTLV